MKAIFSIVLLATLAVVLVLPLAENCVFAQAPTGPQGGAPPPAQQQQNPDSPKATNPAQQAPQAGVTIAVDVPIRSEEHTSELQSRGHLVCRLLLEKKK